MEDKYHDMHMHSVYSDGVEDPRTLMRNMRLGGMDLVALTDHDTTRGYEEAKNEADKYDLELVTGVEISTEKYHILGHYFDYKNRRFQDFLSHSRELQKINVRRRTELLRGQGIPITLEKVEKAYPDREARLGKYNIVLTMLRDNECREFLRKEYGRVLGHKEINKTYLARNVQAGNIETVNVSDVEAIDEIIRAGGVATLAHPFKEVEDISEVDRLLRLGLDKIEVQPNYGERNLKFIEYAIEKRIPTIFGSDYHGIILPRPMLSIEKIEAMRDIMDRNLEEVLVENGRSR